MDRPFLDANVLFSAAHKPGSRISSLWALMDTELVTSQEALDEARRNLEAHNPRAVPRLVALCSSLDIVSAATERVALSDQISLVAVDRSLLVAAIAASCTHFLTGDKRHFAALYGQTVSGVLVLNPIHYLDMREGKL